MNPNTRLNPTSPQGPASVEKSTKPLYAHSTFDRTTLSTRPVPEDEKVVFHHTDKGICLDGEKPLTITLRGSEVFAKTYIFGLLFLYSEDVSLLHGNEHPLVQSVVHATNTGDFFYVYERSLEDAVRDNPHYKYMIRLSNDEKDTPSFLLVNDIAAAAAGLCAVPSDLDIELKADLDFEDCEVINVFDIMTDKQVDLDHLFRMGSTWKSVTVEGDYPSLPLKDMRREIGAKAQIDMM